MQSVARVKRDLAQQQCCYITTQMHLIRAEESSHDDLI